MPKKLSALIMALLLIFALAVPASLIVGLLLINKLPI